MQAWMSRDALLASLPEPARVVCAADDRYAMPLAVALRSALDNLVGQRGLEVHVLDGGIRAGNRARLLASLDRARVELRFLVPDRRTFRHAKVKRGRISLASYFRLVAPRLLPEAADRAIYLDSDLVVQGDLGRLWEVHLGGHPVAAVQDVSVPTLGSPRGLANHRRLGLAPDLKYFNAGVLILDLDRWRRESIPERALAYMKEHRESLRWLDQDVLNAVLAGRFRELDPRWNQLPQVHALDHVTPFEPDVAERVRSDPYIVHFATAEKPWHWICRHPLRELFFVYLDRTAWAGWRPRKGLRDTAAGRVGARLDGALRHRLSRLRRRREGGIPSA